MVNVTYTKVHVALKFISSLYSLSTEATLFILCFHNTSINVTFMAFTLRTVLICPPRHKRNKETCYVRRHFFRSDSPPSSSYSVGNDTKVLTQTLSPLVVTHMMWNPSHPQVWEQITNFLLGFSLCGTDALCASEWELLLQRSGCSGSAGKWGYGAGDLPIRLV